MKGKGRNIKGGLVATGGCPIPIPYPSPSTEACTRGCPLVTFVCATNGC
jgi:hypothetical protein